MNDLNKLIDKFRRINSISTGKDSWEEFINNEGCARETRELAIAFHKYLYLNDYIPQLLETGDICYIKQTENWKCQFEGIDTTKYNKDEVFNKFIDEYYT